MTFAVTPVYANSVELSGPMPAFGDVDEYRMAPNQHYVVYRADQATDDVFELYSARVAGGPATRITPLLPSGESVGTFAISPDSSRVVYTADLDGNGAPEVHSVPITGPPSASVQISPMLPPGGLVSVPLSISGDSSRVVYRAEQVTDGVFDLFSVPITGPPAANVQLNPMLVAGGNVHSFRVTADGARVVYLADQEIDGRRELFSVPVAGPASAAIKLNPTPVAGGAVSPFLWSVSDDSSRAVYIADQEEDARLELYSVPVTGPATAGVKLNAALPAGGDVEWFRLTDDSTRVVYIADQEVFQRRDLYSVPIAGPAGAGVRLNPDLVPLGAVLNFWLSPDSQWVVYRASQDDVTKAELYSVPVAGPQAAARKLNGPLHPLGDVDDRFRISRDSRFVAYLADQEVEDRLELYSVPIAGPATSAIKLSGTMTTGGNVRNMWVSRDSRYVVYQADQLTDETEEIFSVPITGPATAGVRLNGQLVAGGDVAFPWTHPLRHGMGAAYLADQDVDEQVRLYVGGTAVIAPTVGLVDPSQGRWHLRNSPGAVTEFFYGNPGDIPFMGDWDCDGIDTPGLFRQSDAFAYLRNSNTVGIADIRFFFGNPDDVPLAGDFNGDGCDTLSIYRPAEQRFYVINRLGENEGGLGAADYSFVFGNPGDKPVVGDWDGDGIEEVGLHRESTGFFYYRTTLDTGVASDQFFFGDPGDRFVAGDWGIVDAVDTPAVFRPSNTTFFFRHTNTPGVADSQFVWGETGWLPVAGTFGLD